MKDVVIFGGSGFIGRALAENVRGRSSARVIATSSRDVDLADRSATFAWCERLARTCSPEHVFHLAAVYKAGGWPATHPATQFHANMALNVNVLEAWRRFFPSARLTSVLSYCMYPDHDRPHPESELFGTEPEAYLFAYAFTKKALLIGQEAYRKEFGLSATSLVLSTVYGPGDSLSEDSHVMGALIGKFCRALDEGLDEVEVWGDGEQEREFLYVEDAVAGIVEAALHSALPVLNLGQGRSWKIREIAEAIRTVTGFRGRIRYNEDRFVGARRRLLDVTRVRAELDWRPRVSLAEGIRRTLAWRAQSHAARRPAGVPVERAPADS